MYTKSSPARASSDRTSPATSSIGAVLAIAALLFLPVTAVAAGPDRLTLVMQWGFLHLVTPTADAGPHAYPLWQFFAEQPRSFGSLPQSIQAWPVALGLHALALASALLGLIVGREDRRVTGGVLVLAGIATFWVTLGVAHRFGVGLDASLLTVLPIGAVGTWAVAGALYREDVRAIFSPRER
ncbi:MAG: TIGR04206 family protein [Halopenitus sp.]